MRARHQSGPEAVRRDRSHPDEPRSAYGRPICDEQTLVVIDRHTDRGAQPRRPPAAADTAAAATGVVSPEDDEEAAKVMDELFGDFPDEGGKDETPLFAEGNIPF